MQNRKLKAVWTSEEDMKSELAIELEEELTDLLAAEINAEIDSEILRDLRNNAQKEEWGFKKKSAFQPRSIMEDWEVSADSQSPS